MTAAQSEPRVKKWKCGNEYAPYHPQASHVSPDYRDGWNACYAAAESARQSHRGARVILHLSAEMKASAE